MYDVMGAIADSNVPLIIKGAMVTKPTIFSVVGFVCSGQKG